MTDDTAINISVDKPSPTAGELETLTFGLERTRATFLWKCGTLDAEALRRPHPPSTMTLGGLVKHLALVEDDYAAGLQGVPIGPPWDVVDFETDPDWEWRTAADDSPEFLYSLWQSAAERFRIACAEAVVEFGLDEPAKYTSHWGERLNVRRILVDLHEEYARHTGHADLMREAIDGLVGEDPRDA